jgi:cellobiose-specific phosphotransferase system component IIB
MKFKCEECGQTFTRKDNLIRHKKSGACRREKYSINRVNSVSSGKANIKLNPESLNLHEVKKIRVGDKVIFSEGVKEVGRVQLPIGKEIAVDVYYPPEVITELHNKVSNLYRKLVENEVNKALIKIDNEQKTMLKTQFLEQPVVKAVKWGVGSGLIVDGIRRIAISKVRNCDIEALEETALKDEEGRLYPVIAPKTKYISRDDVRYLVSKQRCEQGKWIGVVIGGLEILVGFFALGQGERLMKSILSLLQIRSLG